MRIQVSTWGLVWDSEVLLAERRILVEGQPGVQGAELRLGCDEVLLKEISSTHLGTCS